MLPFLAALSAAAPAIKTVGTVMSAFGALRPNNAGTLDLGRLRRESEANGFNALGVLQATGGAGFYRPQQFSPLSVLGGAMVDVANVSFETQQMERDNRSQDIRDAALLASMGPDRPMGVARASDPMQMFDSPWSGMDFRDIPYVDVYRPDGRRFQIKANLAEQMGLRSGDIWTGEHDEQFYGDTVSEMILIPQAADVAMAGVPDRDGMPIREVVPAPDFTLPSIIVEDLPVGTTGGPWLPGNEPWNW